MTRYSLSVRRSRAPWSPHADASAPTDALRENLGVAHHPADLSDHRAKVSVLAGGAGFTRDPTSQTLAARPLQDMNRWLALGRPADSNPSGALGSQEPSSW